MVEVGRQLVDYADPVTGSTVLDVGAGRGAVARAALARGCAVTAVDASAGMVARLTTDYPQATVRQMDAGRLDFGDSTFDVVALGFVLQVLDDPALAVAEIRRVLAPGGKIALSLETQSIGRLHWLYARAADFFPGAGAGPGDQDAQPMEHDFVDELLVAGGFTDVERRAVAMPIEIAGPGQLWDWLIPRGLAEAVSAVPTSREQEFRDRFLAGAEEMHADGGIVLDFRATLHRAYS